MAEDPSYYSHAMRRSPPVYTGTTSPDYYGGIPAAPLAQETEVEESDLKVLVNTFVWMHAPAAMTLGEADKMACEILEMFLKARERAKA